MQLHDTSKVNNGANTPQWKRAIPNMLHLKSNMPHTYCSCLSTAVYTFVSETAQACILPDHDSCLGTQERHSFVKI